MIDIGDYIYPEVIVPRIRARSKEEVISALLDRLFANEFASDYLMDKSVAAGEVMKREGLQPTGIGHGMAFPHARIEGWGKFALVMGVVEGEGVDFNSPDRIPARIVCMLLTPANAPYLILQVMSAMVRFLHDNESVLARLLGEEPLGADEIAGLFRKKAIHAQTQITAADIVRPVRTVVHLDTPLEEVTRLMHLNHLDIIPVVDAQRKLLGEISCLEAFKYGLPDFFQQLHTVSFVRHIDPFEKYFRREKNLTVGDLYVSDIKPLRKDNTLVEIIFELAVKKKVRLFVTEDDGTLLGVIDRFSIIDKILFI